MSTGGRSSSNRSSAAQRNSTTLTGWSAALAIPTSSGWPRANTSRPSCGLRTSQAASACISSAARRAPRSRSASTAAALCSRASGGSSNRVRSNASHAAVTSQSAFSASCAAVRSCSACTSCSTRAESEMRARSIRCARANVSSASSGPLNPSSSRCGVVAAPSPAAPFAGALVAASAAPVIADRVSRPADAAAAARDAAQASPCRVGRALGPAPHLRR